MACTDPEIGELIGSYELQLLSEEERKRFEEHVVTCDDCLEDLYRMAPVVKRMQEGRPVQARPRGRMAARRNWILLAAGLVIVVAGFYTVMREQAPDERLRGADGGTVVLFEPIGEVPLPQRLDWKPVPPASRYEVTIESADGQALWQKEVEGPPVQLPTEVIGRILPGATYFWRVEAIAPDGTRWKSDTTRFEVWK